MHHFAYRDGVLHAEDIALPALAENVATPFYSPANMFSEPMSEGRFQDV